MNRRAPRTTTIEPMLLTYAEACEYLRVSERWLRDHRGQIGYVGGGNLLRFEKTALDAWIAQNRVGPRAEIEAVAPKRARKPVRLLPRREGTNPVTGKPWGYYDERASR